MENIFTLDKFDVFSEKINIDELYDAKKNRDVNTLNLFQKILNRVHARIKLTSKHRHSQNHCWYVVPEVMIGIPKYDQAGCIAYLINKLKENNFQVQYYHPNTLFINWNHWIPSYIRNEYKKQTGQLINEFGETIIEEKEEEYNNDNPILMIGNGNSNKNKNNKKYNSILNYVPTGSFN